VIRTSADLIGIGGSLFSIWLAAVRTLLSNSGRGGAGRLDHYAGVREAWDMVFVLMEYGYAWTGAEVAASSMSLAVSFE
jgi:hypothetical protein